MLRTMLKSTIHRATVTRADLHHAGSVTLDHDLLDAADLLPGERVTIVDMSNGARLETHVVGGVRGSGDVVINGAAAHLVDRGAVVMVTGYATMDDQQARAHRPRIVFVDAANRPIMPLAEPTRPAETDDAARLDALIHAEA